MITDVNCPFCNKPMDLTIRHESTVGFFSTSIHASCQYCYIIPKGKKQLKTRYSASAFGNGEESAIRNLRTVIAKDK